MVLQQLIPLKHTVKSQQVLKQQDCLLNKLGVFIGLNEAAVVSLTADEMTGVFKAITDSFSKGTLMAEEIKRSVR